MGLTTSSDYTQGGKIIFDPNIDKDGNSGEERLKNFLKKIQIKYLKYFQNNLIVIQDILQI